MEPEVVHEPVLSKEVVELLAPAFAGSSQKNYLDLNLGQGGHALLVLQTFKPKMIIGIDADQDAIKISSKKLSSSDSQTHLSVAWSDELNRVLDEAGIQQVSGVLFDLGLRSDQLEGSNRGFSFRRDEPLLMTMHSGEKPTAADLVNELPLNELEEIIKELGEEKYAKRIAGAIVDRRAVARFERSKDLEEVIWSAVPVSYRVGKIHPATKTFQALRLAVNAELSRLSRALEYAFERLEKGGRMLVISFHSLEDRIVKQKLNNLSREGLGKLLNKKPIVPSEDEKKKNPRSRSAKLRGIEKI